MPMNSFVMLLNPAGKLWRILIEGDPIRAVESTDAGTIPATGWRYNFRYSFDPTIVYADACPYILGQNETTGELRVWYPSYEGTYDAANYFSIGTIGPEWTLEVLFATAVLGHNQSTNELRVWKIAQSGNYADLGGTAGFAGVTFTSNWSVRPVPFQDPGQLDVIVYDTTSGACQLWLDNGRWGYDDLKFTSIKNRLPSIPPAWRPQPATVDTLLASMVGHNNLTGEVGVWPNQAAPPGVIRRTLGPRVTIATITLDWKLHVLPHHAGLILIGQSSGGSLHGWQSHGRDIRSQVDLGSSGDFVLQHPGPLVVRS